MHSQKSVLILGGAGYVGCHVSYLLSSLGYSVTIIDRMRGSHIPQGLRCVRYIRGEWTDKHLLSQVLTLQRYDTAIHCGMLRDGEVFTQQPDLIYARNIIGLHTVLTTLRSAGVHRILLTSGCAVYGQYTQTLRHDAVCLPQTTVGHTLLAAEHLLADYAHAYGLQYAILRVANVAGAMPEAGLGENHVPEQHLIPLLIHSLCTDTPFTIEGSDYHTPDGTAVRDIIHVHDCARAHLHALLHLQETAVSGTYILGSGHAYSVKQVIAYAERIFEKTIPFVIAPRRCNTPDSITVDAGYARSVLDWQPQCSEITFILRSALAWYVQNA